MAANNAVVFEYVAGRHAAIALHQVSELVMAPSLVNVPLAPAYCNRLCLWQDRAVPYVEIAHLAGREAPNNASLALVVNYADVEGRACWGALGLRDYFRIVSVNDADACPLPEDAANLGKIARACFRWESGPAPILDLATLFETRLQ